jgi:head-tail adaptor
MSLPSADEIARWQTDLEAATLPDTCSILSVTRVSDGQGGWTETWGTVASGIACREDAYSSQGLSSFQGSEMLGGGAVQAFSRRMMTLAYGSTVTSANRIVNGSNTYNVVAVDNGKSWAAEVRVIVELV